MVSRRTLAVVGVAGALALGGCAAQTSTQEPSEEVTAEPWSFVSRPDLTPPIVTVTTSERGATLDRDGMYAFLGPKDLDQGSAMQGAAIVDGDGDPVWVANTGDDSAFDLRVQEYQGEPVLTYWVGQSGFHGRGEVIILDDTYTEIARVSTGEPIGAGNADMHETTITDDGTMLLLAYVTAPADLTEVGGPRNGYVLEGHVQEVDIATGEVLFEWASLDEVPVKESRHVLEEDQGTRAEPYDYIHLNAVSLDGDDGFLVSARNTGTVYRLDRESASVDWRLGGRDSDFEIDGDARFAWQHDAHRRADGTITLFDNQSEDDAGWSRGLRLAVDEDAMTAALVTQYTPEQERLSATQGNLQELAGGNVVVGWGSRPFYSEFDRDGTLLYEATFTAGTSYRAYVLPWSASPATPPDAQLVEDGRSASVFASWNGATEVASWLLVTGPDEASAVEIARAPRERFETEIPIPAGATLGAYVGVRAMDAAGEVIGGGAAQIAAPEPSS